jgi:leucyl-tRNA synthetase
MLQLRNQGIILGEDGEKMSKSRGNVVAPDELVARHGADALRAYLMFAYRWQEGGPWSSQGIEGTVRWLSRVWSLAVEPAAGGAAPEAGAARALQRVVHQTIRRVSRDFESFEFNTIVSALMEMTNALHEARPALAGSPAWDEALTTLLLLTAPVAPHITEELWQRLGKPYSIHQQAWPAYDEALAQEERITVVVQINGKVRDRLSVPADIDEHEVQALALQSESIQRHLAGKTPRQIIYVQGRLVNLVT